MDATIIYAAGGIFWKRVSGEFKICLVYRERYGEKWSLPKGKLRENESWEEAAKREVEEETGYRVKILKYADTINYMVNGTPKVVMFWHMKEIGRTSKSLDTEVVKIGWFSLIEALEKIDYEEEKKIISGIQFPGSRFKETSQRVLKVLNIFNFIRKYFNRGTRYTRLEGDIKAYKEELEYRIEKDKTNNISGWAGHARRLVKSSEENLRNGKIDVAWKCFHAAKRMHLFGLTEKELKEEAKIIRIESVKLNEWRRKAIDQLVGSTGNPKDDISPELLHTAALLRDEHYNNIFY